MSDLPLSAVHRDATGGDLTLIRGRGVVVVQATAADGRTVALTFNSEAFGDIVGDTAIMWAWSRRDARTDTNAGT